VHICLYQNQPQVPTGPGNEKAVLQERLNVNEQGVLISMALKIFSRRLKALRKERGLSQTELAQRCKLTINDISRYERGAVSPTLDNFVKIALAIEVSADALLFENGPPSPEAPRNLKLWTRLLDIEQMDKGDQEAVVRLIDAMIAKRKIREVVAR
jgi:transcriptional regulator with XRE-family HTH domain